MGFFPKLTPIKPPKPAGEPGAPAEPKPAASPNKPGPISRPFFPAQPGPPSPVRRWPPQIRLPWPLPGLPFPRPPWRAGGGRPGNGAAGRPGRAGGGALRPGGRAGGGRGK